MKRVLIVSPAFPPVNAADMQRVRASLPYYAASGWEPHVLALRPETHGGPQDADLLATVPRDIPVTRVGGIPVALTRPFGIGTAGLRALPRLYAAGSALIRRHAIDLVFISTTMFPTMVLGRLWKTRHGTPYVLDLQDPWRSDYAGAGAARGPKARAARAMHAALEPFAMRRADGVISVSPAYTETLRRRYSQISESMCATIPFGVNAADFDAARALPWHNTYFDPGDGRIHGVAVGRGGADMALAARILCRALRLRTLRGAARPVALTFVGTDYGGQERSILPVAEREEIGGIVAEWPGRVPYLDGLRLLTDAGFLVILGSDDETYSPSKISPYLASGRPFVAVVHAASPVVALLREAGTGIVVTFTSSSGSAAADVEQAAETLAGELPWVLDRAGASLVPGPAMMERIGARELTRRQCAAFEVAMRHASPDGVPCVE